MRFKGFIGPEYYLEQIDSRRLVNMYLEKNEMGDAKEGEYGILRSTPGLRELMTLDSPVRGFYMTSRNYPVMVAGSKLYSIESDFTTTELGTLSTSSGAVDFSDNGSQLIIVDGPNGYIYDANTGVFTNITSDGWLGSDFVDFLDGYFVLAKPDTGIFYISGLYNGLTYDALEYALTEANPDYIQAFRVLSQKVYFFGTKTIQIYYDSGAVDFPIAPMQGNVLNVGIVAKRSLQMVNGQFIWLGSTKDGSGVVYAMSGFDVQRISTHPLEIAIKSYGDVEDATAYAYQENGHYFYALNFPNADTTWVFDTATNLWAERQYLRNGIPERHRAQYHIHAYGVHIVSDYATGKVYAMEDETFTDGGTQIQRIRVAPHLESGLALIRHNSFELDVVVGVGLNDGTTTQTDPSVELYYSDDKGKTWKYAGVRALGKIGEYKKRLIWRRLGVARDRVYKVVMTDPVAYTLLGAEIT